MKTILATLLWVGFVAYSASAQETKNETGFLLGSEQIPSSTTTAGVPLSVGGNVDFLVRLRPQIEGRTDSVLG